MTKDTGHEAADPFSGAGTNQSGMRESNERLVLSLLRREGGLAKAGIARKTGLSAQTVSRLIGTLEGEGLIRRGDPQRGRVGQPSVPMSLAPTGAYFLGLKVGRRLVEVVLTDFTGQIVDRVQQMHDYPQFDSILNFAVASINRLTERMPPQRRDRVAGLGIAMPFHLWNWAASIGVSPDRMANWRTRDLQAELSARLEIPVFLQNDATAACSAELVFGSAELPENFLSIYIAFFVGGGLVLRGSLFSGATGNAAGLGPLLVPDLDGEMRPLIDLASLVTLETRMLDQGCDARQIWERPEGWDIPSRILDDWVDRSANALAYAVRASQTLLDLDAVLVDGWLPRAVLEDLHARIGDAVGRIDMRGMTVPQIIAGTVGPDARALGAASLPLSARFLKG
ncbi:Sugar kinase of the NBD/HSP70 family, may contain an N-terminal HTH domain [Cribrihabitans marinus]|uniref:Sugar kinase of the NBD/HSP70 family, may contain an N-terminal HTH domain n=1 Tax=Cribrihabitans marinus TaxID=1227549 RepID=A0A1H7D9W7_9RHOB|nr:ROK family transcriptional regulator [Cribrihabitans marinus]GGH37573.1 sugar kinase [Cribrihabitans marinus]SEJ95960.1 Sugar kinase of the NBD/HSP70 family, may contain an N-terminal HTH domain [Cribrihabitans marinus]